MAFITLVGVRKTNIEQFLSSYNSDSFFIDKVIFKRHFTKCKSQFLQDQIPIRLSDTTKLVGGPQVEENCAKQ